MSDSHLNSLINSNISNLKAACQMLNSLTHGEFSQICRPYFDSSVGKHLRHILDHYLCFQRDVQKGTINYDRRQRDGQLETDRNHAYTVMEHVSAFLETLKQSHSAEHPLNVVMCYDLASPQSKVTLSSLGRELQFLQGHSVHHYALMAAMLRFLGKSVDPHFGMAPSTIVHEEAIKESA